MYYTLEGLKTLYPNHRFIAYGENYGESITHDILFIINRSGYIVGQFEAHWFDWEEDDEYFVVTNACQFVGHKFDDVIHEWIDGGFGFAEL